MSSAKRVTIVTDEPTTPSFLSKRFQKNADIWTTGHKRLPSLKHRDLKKDVENEEEIADGELGASISSPSKPKEEDREQPKEIHKYQPFPLSAKSSYNSQSLPKKQLNKLPLYIRAKYSAYEAPTPSLAAKIGESEYRSQKLLANKHKEISQLVEEHKNFVLKKRGICDQEIAQEGARKARERLRARRQNMMELKEMELTYLVEGQNNSVDAIRLKEHLPIKVNKIVLERIVGEKERLRIQELLTS